MKQLDISHVLDGWPYEPGKAMVRKVEGKDGRELIQMRIDLGLLQCTLPDDPMASVLMTPTVCLITRFSVWKTTLPNTMVRMKGFP